jgi:hypothetical protein
MFLVAFSVEDIALVRNPFLSIIEGETVRNQTKPINQQTNRRIIITLKNAFATGGIDYLSR